jgi:hypothetical protein
MQIKCIHYLGEIGVVLPVNINAAYGGSLLAHFKECKQINRALVVPYSYYVGEWSILELFHFNP